jgi:uncharacterized protein
MIKRSLILALTAGAFCVVLSAPTWAQSQPSWCGSQDTLNPAERTVCARRTLWGLDENLNAAYQDALRRAGRHRSELVRDQASWIRGPRNGCGANVSCLSRVYSDRIVTLGDLYN